MPTDPTIDIEALLAPIPGEDPAGAISSFDDVFGEIRRAREEVSRDAFEDKPIAANWPLVVARASDTIRSRAKDLRLATNLTEALSELYGFAGFRDGLQVTRGLLERYWDGVYPRIDEGNIAPRLAPLIWMTEATRGARLPNRLREVPIVPSPDGDRGMSLAFQKSCYAPPKTENEDADAYERRRAEAEDRSRRFQDAVVLAPAAHLGLLREDLEQCSAEIAKLDAVLNERFGVEGPSLTPLREAIEDCAALVGRLFREKGGETGPIVVPPPGPGGGTTVTTTGTSLPGGAVASRQEALNRLREVAAFFRQTEPHSPIPYLIERAASWGGLSLEQLVQELVKDSGTREQIGELLGFKREE